MIALAAARIDPMHPLGSLSVPHTPPGTRKFAMMGDTIKFEAEEIRRERA
jgi:hypothetical protein